LRTISMPSLRVAVAGDPTGRRRIRVELTPPRSTARSGPLGWEAHATIVHDSPDQLCIVGDFLDQAIETQHKQAVRGRAARVRRG
jgi:hypothetical protein